MTTPTASAQTWSSLSSFLVGGQAVPDGALLAEHALEALAYTRVPPTDPRHARWRDAYLLRVAVHLSVRATLAPLVQAWREQGIEVLLFKGFYLAEFVYANPAERFYKDVDILVRHSDAVRARTVAAELGWVTLGSRDGATDANRHGHMEAILRRGNAKIDLHRFVIHKGTSPDERQAQRVTAAAWDASRELAWEGTTVRVLDPRDSALLGIATGRAWSHDGWQLKLSDYRDVELLAEVLGLTRDALQARARKLGCPETLRLFLERCDPWRKHLDLVPPTRSQIRAWSRAVASERTPRGLWRRRVPVGVTAAGFTAVLPDVLRARRWVARHREAQALLAQVDAAVSGAPPSQAVPLTKQDRSRLFANVRWAAIAAQPAGDRCLVRSIALFVRLRAHGESVTLHLGADAAGRLHAWLRFEEGTTPQVTVWASCPVASLVGSLAAGGHATAEA
jgi:hypothetical protein